MSTGMAEPELLDGESTEYIDGASALMALNKSEIDTQIATAKRWPRSVVQFKQNCMELACLDEETAASMFYVLPRGGKKIEGPSARLAEVVGSSWGNMRYGARIVSTDDKFVTAQGACFDLEKNIAMTVEVKRRITDKNGKRYNDDMIQVTANAACSIALRQAIFKVIPFALVKPVYEQARQCSIGKADSMDSRRHRAVEWFVKAGATQEQVLAAIDRKGIEDITVDDLVTLTGLRTAIKDGESTIEEALGPVPDTKAKVRKSDLNETLNSKPKNAETKPATKGKQSDASSAFAELGQQIAACKDNSQLTYMECEVKSALDNGKLIGDESAELLERIGDLRRQLQSGECESK